MPLSASAQSSTAQVWVRRTVVPSSINYEGAPANTQATVNLWSWASGDSVAVGKPIDVIFLTDNGPKIQSRLPGDPHNWISPNRIEGAYNASVNFIDSFFTSSERCALLRFASNVDTAFYYTTNYPYAKGQLDSSLTGDATEQGNAMWKGILASAQYAVANLRPNVTPVIIALTTGNDRNSYQQGLPPGALGNTEAEAVDSVLSYLESARVAGIPIKVFIVGVGSGVNDNDGLMTMMADSVGGMYIHTEDGIGIDSVFQDIGQRLVDIVGIRVSPTKPMFVDVLGPGIHYVPGSFLQVGSQGDLTPAFSVDTVNGLTRITLALDTIKLGQLFLVRYNITAAVTILDTTHAVLTRTNNTQLNDSVNYSRIQYMDIFGRVTEKPIPQNFVLVKSGVSAIRLSLSPDTLIPPSLTKVVPLEYTSTAPAVFPDTTLYALLELDMTGEVLYTPATVTWNFTPLSGWTAPLLYNVQDDQQGMGITVPFDNAGLCTLTIELTMQGLIYRDYLIFSAYGEGSVEKIIGVAIDDDTLTRQFIDPPRLLIAGNRAELNAYSQPLFARAITNHGNILPLSASWSASGFSIYQSQLGAAFTGTHQQRTFGISVATTETAQSDSGLITIDSGGLSFSFTLAILDTSHYDVVNTIAIYDNYYAGNTDSIEAHYSGQQSQEVYSPGLGDSLTFWPLLFDASGTPVQYMDVATAVWQRNNNPPVTASYYVVRGGVPMLEERLTVTFVGQSGDTLTDTVTIRWGYGSIRHISLESRPGHIGDTVSAPLTALVIPANADTMRGIYAVVRDEYGYCVYDGSDNNFTAYAAWSVSVPGVLTYIDIPADTTSLGWIHRKGTPGSQTTAYLVASGVNLVGLYNQKDSIALTLLTYSFDSLVIQACASPSPLIDTTGHVYAVGEDIPKSALLFLTAGQDTSVVRARIRRDDTNAWVSWPVSWRLTDMYFVDVSGFPIDSQMTIIPMRNVTRTGIIAYLDFGGGIIVTDTVYCMVDISFIDSFIMVFPDYPIIAGDTFSFTIIAIDQNGDTVRNPVRLPNGYTLSLNTLLLLMGASDTLLLNDTTAGITDPFLNGISINNGVLYFAGDNLLVISFTYPTKTGTATYTDTIRISVRAGPPDSIAVIREKDSTLAVSDTLSSVHTETSDSVLFYQIVLYDRFGNAIPASSGFYDSLVVTVSGTLDTAGIIRDGNRIGYSAANALDGASGTITVRYTGPSADIAYAFDLLIVPVAQVLLIETHEWVPDTVSGIAFIRTVLDSVLGIDPDSLWIALQARGSSQNQVYLAALQANGYMPFRDGYLDYLDITLSMPFAFKNTYISAIRFDAQTYDGPDSVVWRVSDLGRTIRLLPRGPGNTLWRLWLITNAGQSVHAPFETGLLPSVSFDNNAIRQANSHTNFPVLIGTDGDIYSTDMAITVDSTPPVIAGFRFQNNACKIGEPENRIFISFSEPVATGAISIFSSITAFTIDYRTRTDSGFMSTAILEASPSGRVYDTLEAWSYDGDAAYTMTYEAVVNKDSNAVFIPGMTKIRFSVKPVNTQFADATGNRGCVSANRKAVLVSDGQTDAYVCSLIGTTIISRYDAMTFAWGGSTEGGTPQAVPLFHFFGFTVNMLQIVADNPRTFVIIDDAVISGRHFVVCDFDTTTPLIETMVKIYDVYGNLVASPATNAALSASFTVGSLREFMGFGAIENDLATLTISDIEKSYSITEAVSPSDPDTLRPIYPTTLSLGYDYLSGRCGPSTGRDLCMPAWNCLNAKGRLVAPGGYVGAQDIRTGRIVTEAVKKILVTSGSTRKSSY
ncbi:MAG: hypothetical protein A2248_08460 [Candidatus Raymondbacteria bacterium RIFOXYA2_FULL_49_16]|uniref:VWFA domain-containing protein n=1 Tax=Candidatus Raymondbacteria bacterium RIFOXYD12_FULL_49_13 TaxID=1817890 RepID=A0A1F7FGA4_UNCRA|nr:MAG: hypothetical protein A2248_08460 [Candidatus Raymondbacteria bacterium RIFOXYA2_FULL_49_16]OGK05725.1 MAG: hypothetical protein A2519_04015 [Candidatus Raymondbacteria bacterium RIFOXYD12_FULL_49_13]OGP44650.1 MAG: hypothetical protein A2324_08355 [Candidatus Raymondbacteria bacterium RIFOXYB2_FULL_49_35]